VVADAFRAGPSLPGEAVGVVVPAVSPTAAVVVAGWVGSGASSEVPVVAVTDGPVVTVVESAGSGSSRVKTNNATATTSTAKMMWAYRFFFGPRPPADRERDPVRRPP